LPSYTVHFYDLRYAYPGRPILLNGRVELDDKLNVVQQCLGRRCQ